MKKYLVSAALLSSLIATTTFGYKHTIKNLTNYRVYVNAQIVGFDQDITLNPHTSGTVTTEGGGDCFKPYGNGFWVNIETGPEAGTSFQVKVPGGKKCRGHILFIEPIEPGSPLTRAKLAE